MLKHLLAVLAVATAAILALAPATARAAANDDAPGSHWYMGVGVGSATSSSITSATYYSGYPYEETDTFSSSGTGAAFRVLGGWRWLDRRGDGFGIGLSDTGVSLGDSTGAGILGLDLNAKVHLAGAWFISARVGAYSGRKFVYYSNDYYSYSGEQNGTFYGFGTGIDINASNALAVTWDRYQISDFTDDSVDPPSRISDAHLDVYMLTYTYTF